MNVANAVNILTALAAAAGTIAVNAQKVGELIKKAQAEGRDTFTPDEWREIAGLDDAARARLEQVIATKSGG